MVLFCYLSNNRRCVPQEETRGLFFNKYLQLYRFVHFALLSSVRQGQWKQLFIQEMEIVEETNATDSSLDVFDNPNSSPIV